MKFRPDRPKPTARLYPYKFNEEVAAAVLRGVQEGKGVKGACDALGISRDPVRSWATSNQRFAEQLAAARRDGYEVWADEILTISDAVAKTDSNATVQAARLACESRKWLLAKLHPGQYGDRVEVTGKDGRDLIPSAEAVVPRLMSVLTVLLPQADNSELHVLASSMASKLMLAAPAAEEEKTNGHGHP
jgi:hypothetical protein